jgi:hypothetical protein
MRRLRQTIENSQRRQHEDLYYVLVLVARFRNLCLMIEVETPSAP